MSEKRQNLPFLDRTHVLVPVPKVGTGTHGQKQGGIGTNKVVPVPIHKTWLVPVPIKGVPVSMLLAALIFVSVHY